MFSLAHNHEGKKVMKSNLFCQLSAGVAGVAGVTLVAIGVISTPVQAARIAIGFFEPQDSTSLAFGNYFYYNYDLEPPNQPSTLDSWDFRIYQNKKEITSMETYRESYLNDISYQNNTLTIKYNSPGIAKILFPDVQNKSTLLSFVFEKLDRSNTRYSNTGYISMEPYSQRKLEFDYDSIVLKPGIPTTDSGSGNSSGSGSSGGSVVGPEPSTYAGTILAFAVLSAAKIVKRKQKNKETFTP